MRLRLLASGSLALGGLVLMGMGAYFALFVTADTAREFKAYWRVHSAATGYRARDTALANSRFSVLGGYIFATGLLTAYVAATSFRTAKPVTTAVVAIAGLASIGWMAITNFQIDLISCGCCLPLRCTG